MMNKLRSFYQQYKNFITNIVFPLILLIYPLIKVNQGIDVSDSTYSLSNALYFPKLRGMWVVSTYLSNVVGFILTKLPFGTTLLGMNVYTGLIVSALALVIYLMLRKWMPDWIVFAGEFIALGFLWIPTGILYNYLTYFLFALGALFLYKGLVEEKQKYLLVAGVVLGANVWVRIPNLTEMALIGMLWYYQWLNKKTVKETFRKTGICVGGYALGVAVPAIMVFVQYGIQGITDMISGLSGIQSTDNTYSVFSMVLATFEAYIRSFKWVMFVLIGMGMGFIMFTLMKDSFILIKKLIYGVGLCVLLRFFWGRGMFSFRYYEDYTSMYEWGMMGLYLAIVACVYLFAGKGVSLNERLFGMMSFIIIMITPIGSNNYTYQNLNNLFVVAPVTMYAFVKLYRRRVHPDAKNYAFVWQSTVMVIGVMIFVQTVGFHTQFVFRDGMDGSKRDTKVSANEVVAGMYTTAQNAKDLEGLITCFENNKRQEAIYFGDCPGLPFILQMPSAVDSSWPELDSEPIGKLEANLMELEELPYVVIRNIEPSSISFMDKLELLYDFMSVHHYDEVYVNDTYSVYAPSWNN